MPQSANPNLLVGFETSDDAGAIVLPSGEVLLQTMDFFTPIVDDPYVYGQIAAVNALSDIYAMGGKPISVMNIACFDPDLAPAETWALVLAGMADKTLESGAVCVGGHTVVDREPKFGMAVTGLVARDRIWSNNRAKPGDQIYLTKPLGTGIITTAAKQDDCSADQLREAMSSMIMLNTFVESDVQSVNCATDITGFGLMGHLYNVSRASQVRIEIDFAKIPMFGGVEELIRAGHTTGGALKNQEFVGDAFQSASGLPPWCVDLVFDPQTSGGLALFSSTPIKGAILIGRVTPGKPGIDLN